MKRSWLVLVVGLWIIAPTLLSSVSAQDKALKKIILGRFDFVA